MLAADVCERQELYRVGRGLGVLTGPRLEALRIWSAHPPVRERLLMPRRMEAGFVIRPGLQLCGDRPAAATVRLLQGRPQAGTESGLLL